MVERGGDGFEIGTDWGAWMDGGVDRDRHRGRSWSLNVFFFSCSSAWEGNDVECMSANFVCVKIRWRKVALLRAGKCGERPPAVAYDFSLAYLLPAFILCQGACGFTNLRVYSEIAPGGCCSSPKSTSA